MKKGWCVFFIFALFFLFEAPSLASLEYLPSFLKRKNLKVKLIEIKGNKRIDKRTILFDIMLAPGDTFSVEAVRSSIKNLYKTGFFENIEVDASPFEGGVKLTFIVKENPFVKSVEIAGNEHVSDDDIKAELKDFPFSVFNEKTLYENIISIKKIYQKKGYYSVKVDIVKIRYKDEIELIYQIREGKKASIASIEFIGNKFFKDSYLKDLMFSKEKTPWNVFSVFWSNLFGRPYSYYYVEDLLKYDLERIKDAYRDNGFMKVRIGEPEISIKDDKIYIKIPIDEGARYRISGVGVRVDKDIPYSASDIKGMLTVRKGQYYSISRLRKDINKILDAYGRLGYVHADVRPVMDSDDKKHEVFVEYRINVGKQFFIKKIEITGNKKTVDKVIRRELSVYEADVLNMPELKISKRNIKRLGFFSKVSISTEPAGDNLMDVNINVEEEHTGSLMIGGGYSSVEAFGFMIRLSERNLFGTGRSISLNAEFTSKRTEYYLYFYDPYIFDTKNSFSFKIFDRFYFYTAYSEHDKGGEVKLGRRIFGRDNKFYVGYEYKYVDIYDVTDTAALYIKQQQGITRSSSVLFDFIRDTRDHPIIPTEGSRFMAATKISGFGGDVSFYKFYSSYDKYVPIKNFIKGSVFHLKLRYGIVEPTDWKPKGIPIYERFFVGGQSTVRGFYIEEATPTINGDPVGGNKEFIANIEYLFTLVGDLKGILFFDTGAAFYEGESIAFSQMRKGAGFGFRIFTPIGPVKLDWGYKLDRKEGEDNYRFHFSIGTIF